MNGIELYQAYAHNKPGYPTYRIEIQKGPRKRWTTRWANMTLRRCLIHYDGTVLMPGWRMRVVREDSGETLFTSDVQME